MVRNGRGPASRPMHSQYCGMERTWRRRDMLGRRLRTRLAWSMSRIQGAVTCPAKGCGGPLPILRLMQGGYQDGLDRTDPVRRRSWLVKTLLDAGLSPADLGLA